MACKNFSHFHFWGNSAGLTFNGDGGYILTYLGKMGIPCSPGSFRPVRPQNHVKNSTGKCLSFFVVGSLSSLCDNVPRPFLKSSQTPNCRMEENNVDTDNVYAGDARPMMMTWKWLPGRVMEGPRGQRQIYEHQFLLTSDTNYIPHTQIVSVTFFGFEAVVFTPSLFSNSFSCNPINVV